MQNEHPLSRRQRESMDILLYRDGALTANGVVKMLEDQPTDSAVALSFASSRPKAT